MKADRAEVKVSLYLDRQKRALLVAGNLGHEVVSCKLVVDLKAMGLAGRSAVNMLDDRPLAVEKGILPVRLRPASFALIQLE